MKKTTIKFLFICISLQFIAQVLSAQAVVVTGELRQWHKITLTIDGPATSETATVNPFTNYNLTVTFTKGTKTFMIPGYYAACGDAANTSCTSGNKWKVHFSPNETGVWNYSISFKQGANVALNGGGTAVNTADGSNGSVTIIASNKNGIDLRAKGRLNYVGKHYLQFEGTNEWFIKAGPDSPENTLAYEDFDATPNLGNRRKSWQPHQQDYNAVDAASYTWAGGKGTELLGVANYLAMQGMTSISFLSFNLNGDDGNVFPHLESVANADAWNEVHHDRFDCSKLDQWEKFFEYTELKGLFLHFKTMETENDNLMDGNSNGPERKLYYREIIARFGHHLALNWNITEECSMPVNVVKGLTTYIKNTDPYNHHLVLHTYPGDIEYNTYYGALTGNNSELTGASMQIAMDSIHAKILTWVNNSATAGKNWAVANDEQGSASIGVNKDPLDRDLVRNKVLWGTLLAGGYGVEYYYGYQTTSTDLNSQDHRTRNEKWEDAKFALAFFKTYFNQYLPDVTNSDNITSSTTDYVLGKTGVAYAVYLPTGGTTNIALTPGTWTVKWYNPRTGVMNTGTIPVIGSLQAPDNNDWVALVTKANITNIQGYTINSATAIYPNPIQSGEFLNVNSNYEIRELLIYNNLGELCWNQIGDHQKVKIDLKQGVYHLIIKRQDGKMENQKLVVNY